MGMAFHGQKAQPRVGEPGVLPVILAHMKTAISLPDELFAEIDACARRLRMTRSGLLAQAAREFVARRRRAADPTEAWNQAIEKAGQPGNEPGGHCLSPPDEAGRARVRRETALIRRGQIWWVDLGEPRGSRPGCRHPALVLQRDEVNASRITPWSLRPTSNRALAKAPGNVLLPKRSTGLRRDSVANASQIATVNKEDLDTLVGAVPARLLEGVSEGSRWFLELEH